MTHLSWLALLVSAGVVLVGYKTYGLFAMAAKAVAVKHPMHEAFAYGSLLWLVGLGVGTLLGAGLGVLLGAWLR